MKEDNKDLPGYAIINGKAYPMTRRQLEAHLVAQKQAAQKQFAALKDVYESNADVQRHRARPTDENTADAVDKMVETVKTFEDSRNAESTSEEAARVKAREVARKSGIADA
jgi:methylthioribose-1-phosphate isomerase